MHKKVSVRDLRIGMFIHELGVPWWQHSFLLPRFRIDSQASLEKLRSCGAEFVVIDLDKGLDVESTAPQIEVASPVEPEPIAPVAPAPVRVSLDEELQVAEKLLRQARVAVKNTMRDARTGVISGIPQMRELAQGMMESATRNSGALLSLAGLKTKDDYTFAHCVATGAFMIALGTQLGMDEDELREAGTAGLLHDVGKMRVPDQILNKPGRLTEEEFKLMRAHPELGYQMLLDAGYEDSAALEVVLHHHERLDGRGYPHQLSTERLTRLARMGAVVDVYDAVTSDRCYHKAIPPTAALKMMLGDSGKHFDGDIVKAFIKTVGIYPNRSLVRLKSGRLAVVLEQCETDAKTPRVRVFFSIKSNLPMVPFDLNLAQGTDEILSFEDPDVWGLEVAKLSGLDS